MEEIDEAVEKIMEEIDAHELAGTGYDRSTSADFYEAIAEICKERAAMIREEDHE